MAGLASCMRDCGMAAAYRPLPPVLYFLSPKEESVELLIDDWKAERPYLHAHVFFTNRLPDPLIDSIGRSRAGCVSMCPPRMSYYCLLWGGGQSTKGHQKSGMPYYCTPTGSEAA